MPSKDSATACTVEQFRLSSLQPMNTEIISAVRTVGIAKPAKAVYAHAAKIDMPAMACTRLSRKPSDG